MKKLLYISLFLVSLFTTTLSVMAQNPISEELPLFHTIDVSGNIHLILAPSQSSSEQKISYEEYGDSRAKFKYEVKKGVLYLTLSTGIIDRDNSVRVIVSGSQVKKLLSQGAIVETLRKIDVEKFVYQSKGSQNVAKLNLDCTNVEVRTSGYCDVMLQGRVHDIEIVASSGSRVDALELKYTEFSAKANLGAEVYLRTQGNITELKASTSATIYYYGSSDLVTGKTSFGGDLVQISEQMNNSSANMLWNAEGQPLKSQKKEKKTENKQSVDKSNSNKKSSARVADDEDFF